MQSNSKILVIRFSSFGDVTQSLSIPSKIAQILPQSEIHFITRKDYASLLEGHPNIYKSWLFDKKQGLWGLIKIAFNLRTERFTHIYDAHNNLRSLLITLICRLFRSIHVLRRPTYRWKRILLFTFRINTYQMPFSGQRDLLEALTHWGADLSLPKIPQIFLSDNDQTILNQLIPNHFKNYICLAPSAAYHLKRWPKDYFIDLIKLLPEYQFVLLGGPEDGFIVDIQSSCPDRCINLAGKLSYKANAAAIRNSKLLVSNDTGLMHIAEQLGHPCIALMGPAPFGFPSRPTTKILEKDLKCRPCSKHGQGPCVNAFYHECLVDIKPTEVASWVHSWVKDSYQKLIDAQTILRTDG